MSKLRQQLDQYCESPIEKMLGFELAEAFSDYQDWDSPPRLIAQQKVDRFSDPDRHYRLDFAVIAEREWPYPTIRIAIECDGHNFHERTKAQARRDRQRDRDLQASGWIVLRFTGQEIYEDAAACAHEAAVTLEMLTLDEPMIEQRDQEMWQRGFSAAEAKHRGGAR